MSLEKAPVPDATPVPVSTLAAEQVARMPEPTPGYTDPADAAKQAYAGLRDSQGATFDPAIHETNPDGTPRISDSARSRGMLLRRRGVKKGGADAQVRSRLAEKTQSVAEAQSGMAPAEAGRHAANAFIALNVQMFGQDFAPRKAILEGVVIDEQTEMQRHFGNYFQAKNWRDIPPGIALAICVGGYYIARANTPAVQGKFQKAKEWIARKIAERRARKNGAMKSATTENAHTDSRHDGQRQDNVSKTVVPGVQRARR